MHANDWRIEWSSRLDIGIPEIDAEHRAFIARVNDLNEAIVAGREKAVVERLLDAMIREAASHFRNEQQLLGTWSYPDLAEHTAKHRELMHQFAQVMDSFQRADVSFTWAAKGLHLKQLLVTHLLQEDMKFRDFLRKAAKAGTASKSASPRRKP